MNAKPRTDAELTAAALDYVRACFAYVLSQPGVDGPWIMTEDNSFTGRENLICWEEAGYDWALEVDFHPLLEEHGIFVEPYNGFTVSVNDDRTPH